ncbi:hypothetical protein Poly24_21600 [Rosistilla carotiformis]|uniref:Uncharacterized protein n=1 Tax=Rosistilla carotiformis TaxID=2528017 RepID=A0A518JSB9_9BACT|nr:hypothetical protein [Rosistilla carotiformis]QDV68451.1 hypothetical protein Poly24_21600 [Rosistilla carotiformis]
MACLVASLFATAQGADDFGGQLASTCRVTGTELPLRVVAHRIGETHQINVWIDRRIDPTTPVSLSASAGSLQQTLEAIATQADLEVGYADPIVIVAPQGRAIDAATRILALRSELKELPISVAKRLLQPHDLDWPRATTPAEIAEQISQTWNVLVAGDSLPHDLWDRSALRQIDAGGALVLLAEGFDLVPQYDLQTATFRMHPIEEGPAVGLDYPAAKVTASVTRALRKIDPEVTFEKRGALIRVTGNSSVHHRIRNIDAVPNAKPNKGLAAVEPQMRRFTLRIPGVKPAASILQAVCNASGFTLDTSAASSERLKMPVSLEVEDQLATEIIESICAQAGLTVRFDATTAIVADPT